MQKEPPTKKGELLQLRVEKSFHSQLTAVSEFKGLPLSAMLRTWIAKCLTEELQMITKHKSEWETNRFTEIDTILDTNFERVPAFVVHAQAQTPGVEISMKDIRQYAMSLIPARGISGFNGRINQFGYEATREKDGVIHARAQIFKTGQIEGIFAVDVNDRNNKEIFGLALDDGIVTVVRAYARLLNNLEVMMPYSIRVSLLKAKGYSLTDYPTIARSHAPTTFQSDRIHLQEIVLRDSEQFETEQVVGDRLVKVIDELWNAAGEENSPSYGDDNKWKVRK